MTHWLFCPAPSRQGISLWAKRLLREKGLAEIYFGANHDRGGPLSWRIFDVVHATTSGCSPGDAGALIYTLMTMKLSRTPD